MNMFNWISDNRDWLFEGSGTIAFVSIFTYLFKKKSSGKSIHENPKESLLSIEIDKDKKVDKTSNYKHDLGKRHKWLRSEVLQLTLREMTDFYKFDSVSELEKYENGSDELPLISLKKLESFFFLNPRFLEIGKQPIFKSFHLCSENFLEYLENGFFPLIACCPYDRGDLFCYIVFQCEERGFRRIRKADLLCSFASNGGGRINIQYLINEMLARNMDSHEVSILRATENEWQALEDDTYYDKSVFYRFSNADWECAHIFNSWYEESSVSQKDWKSHLCSLEFLESKK